MSSSRPRLVLVGIVVLSLLGVVAFFTMPRKEDPTFPPRYGVVTVALPGGDAQEVQAQVVHPLERELEQLAQVRHIDSVARDSFGVLTVELQEDVYDTDTAWAAVRRAMTQAHGRMPLSAAAPVLDSSLTTPESIVLAVTGDADPLTLLAAARRARRALVALDDVAEVRLVGDPGEQLTVDIDPAVSRRLGLPPAALAQQIEGRIRRNAAGSLDTRDLRLSPRADDALATLADLEQLPVRLAAGASVPLSELGPVRLSPASPARPRMRHRGRRAVGLSVLPVSETNLIQVGTTVRARLSTLREELAPLEIEEVAFQPDYVEARLAGLLDSLGIGIVIVALCLWLFLGRRSAILVAAAVPAICLGGLSLYWIGGGVLHQMSIAAFVIALGMIVDNAIVVVESIERGMADGLAPEEAARRAVRALRMPLVIATLTTIAAFIPMAIASGTTADFTRSLPIVLTITLSLSLLCALFVIPVLAPWLLTRGRRRATIGASSGLMGRASGRAVAILAGLAADTGRARRRTLVLAGAALLGGLTLAAAVPTQFFPDADRNQFLVVARLARGSSLDATDRAAAVLERSLVEVSGVAAVTAFVGRSAPRFYYNIVSEPSDPALAQLLVTTTGAEHHARIEGVLRRVAETQLPEVDVVVKPLAQGPALAAPIEVRLLGEPAQTFPVSDAVMRIVRGAEGSRDVRRQADLGAPSEGFEPVEAALQASGTDTAAVSAALLSASHGLPAGLYRGDGRLDPVPVVVRSRPADASADGWASLPVQTAAGSSVPLAQVARPVMNTSRSELRRRDGAPVTRVLSELAVGVSLGSVVSEIRAGIAELELPPGVQVELGGAAEGAGDANGSMLRALPVGAVLLLFLLFFQFDSIRRVALILVTVPLAGAGVVPGLLLGGQPFGFMALLGVIALAGVVVNNAIVLLDVVEQERSAGRSVPEALAQAVALRTRPIVVTSATTVLGLLPLSFSGSPLWPPLAWAMISGLIASTGLTLVVVPALYSLLFAPRLAATAHEPDDTIVDPGLAERLAHSVVTPLPTQPREKR